MARACFFRRFGVFVKEDFLDEGSCGCLREEMRAAPAAPATVWTSEGQMLDETTRHVKWVDVRERTEASMRERFLAVRPVLEEHFGVALQRCQRLQFLVYGAGAFYLPHQDTNRSADPDSDFGRRKVAAVLFLNGQADRVDGDCFVGGSLAFYGLLTGEPWASLGLPLEAAPGLLVAFSATLVHEVQPVRGGSRYTVVSWLG